MPTPYLPQYQVPGYDAASGQNTGSMGYMTLPVESTSGGFENNIWNPNATPYPTGFTRENKLDGLDPGVNPYLQGYFSGGKWMPYLPGKTVIGSRQPAAPAVGNATQWVNGREYNVNGNNYEAGQTGPKPYEFATAPGDARMSEAAAPDGFHFGEQGQPGYRFMAGAIENGKISAKQPQYAPDRNLGVLQPWNPAAAALQQYRSQP
jgi:hypothetical protein